ncbi:MAG: ATP-binding protein [Eubacterium ramulus]
MGKTFLSHCIAKELLDTGHSVIYFSAHQLFEILTENALGQVDTREFDYRNIFDCDLLIIDDLGTEADEYADDFSVFRLHERTDHEP